MRHPSSAQTLPEKEKSIRGISLAFKITKKGFSLASTCTSPRARVGLLEMLKYYLCCLFFLLRKGFFSGGGRVAKQVSISGENCYEGNLCDDGFFQPNKGNFFTQTSKSSPYEAPLGARSPQINARTPFWPTSKHF